MKRQQDKEIKKNREKKKKRGKRKKKKKKKKVPKGLLTNETSRSIVDLACAASLWSLV